MVGALDQYHPETGAQISSMYPASGASAWRTGVTVCVKGRSEVSTKGVEDQEPGAGTSHLFDQRNEVARNRESSVEPVDLHKVDPVHVGAGGGHAGCEGTRPTVLGRGVYAPDRLAVEITLNGPLIPEPVRRQ